MDKLLEVDHLTKVFSFGSMLSRIRITAADNVSFYIKPAEIFALAGESGCGKSTTARMILGFEEPTSGTILYSGKKVARSEKVWFTQGIQAIFQDPFGTFNPLRTVDRYFFETVQNYMGHRSKDVAIKLIDHHLKAVGLTYEEVSSRYPSEFSGGQLQRISIARALLIDPRILILDEATSSVDAETEKEIQNALDNLVRGRTTIAIAHRLSTLRRANRLVVMDRGKIVEVGSHEELIARQGAYYRLYEAQARNVDAEELSLAAAWPAATPPQHLQKREEAKS